MDPVCIAKWEECDEDKEFKTEMKEDAGKEPKWEESFEVHVKDMHETVIFTVMDINTVSDDTIGYFKIEWSALCFNNGSDEWYLLWYKNKPAGKLRLITEFEPDNGGCEAQVAGLLVQMQSMEDRPELEDLVPIDLMTAKFAITVEGSEPVDKD